MAKTIKELTQDLLQAPSACKEVKEAAQNYLDAAGTEKEADAATAYVKELEADIMPIDNLIGFAESEGRSQYFGVDAACPACCLSYPYAAWFLFNASRHLCLVSR